ncbi:MAG: cytochrome-c peroxidase [Bacteroidia bacterium]|nr:cytochrome-c peroxidase [Bacteroidia bacterium]
MRRTGWIGIVCVALSGCVILGYAGGGLGDAKSVERRYERLSREGWPKPILVFSNGVNVDAEIALGRVLFYDESLSADGKVSCGSCHTSYTAFAHVDHKLSHGVFDRESRRNAPALMNLAWQSGFMWDGAIQHLELQSMAPIAAHTEMGMSLQDYLNGIKQNPRYQTLFALAYPNQPISLPLALKAIARFELTFVSDQSRYDSMRRQQISFTQQENRGYALFQKFCAACHAEPLFTRPGYEYNGWADGLNGMDSAGTLVSGLDRGRALVTGLVNDAYHMKIPTLRNVEVSFPYMHNGGFQSLYQVVKNYSGKRLVVRGDGGGSGNSGDSGEGQRKVIDISLDANERVDLVAFLMTLTDRKFLYSKDFVDPRQSPRK